MSQETEDKDMCVHTCVCACVCEWVMDRRVNRGSAGQGRAGAGPAWQLGSRHGALRTSFVKGLEELELDLAGREKSLDV